MIGFTRSQWGRGFEHCLKDLPKTDLSLDLQAVKPGDLVDGYPEAGVSMVPPKILYLFLVMVACQMLSAHDSSWMQWILT